MYVFYIAPDFRSKIACYGHGGKGFLKLCQSMAVFRSEMMYDCVLDI